MQNLCKTCRWWGELKIFVSDEYLTLEPGECRMRAPTKDGWPRARSTDFCGEWANKDADGV